MTPTDADRERAREILANVRFMDDDEDPDPAIDFIAAAIAEARRGALNECARWHDERYVDLRDNGARGPNGLASGMTGARMYEHREAAEHFRAPSQHPTKEGLMPDDGGYSPAEIVDLFTPPHGLQGHEVAMMMQRFWPTIKAALLAYNEATAGAKIKPIPISID